MKSFTQATINFGQKQVITCNECGLTYFTGVDVNTHKQFHQKYKRALMWVYI